MPLNFYKVLINLQFQICLSRTPLASPLYSSHHWLNFFFPLKTFCPCIVPHHSKFILKIGILLHSSLSMCPFFFLYPVIEGHSHPHCTPIHWLIYLPITIFLSGHIVRFLLILRAFLITSLFNCFSLDRSASYNFWHSDCLYSLLQITFLIKWFLDR